MAELSGRDCVCCTDPRPFHGQRLAFSAKSSLSCPPAIRTDTTVLSRLCNPVYATYFCKYAICQAKDEFYVLGNRRIRYYIHCHCDSPGSLQCMAATAAMVEMCKELKLNLYNAKCVPAPKLCCDSWLCCPIRCLGMVTCPAFHYFMFQMSELSNITVDMWRAKYEIDIIPVHDSLFFVCVICHCNLPHSECARRCSAFYNYLRMLMSCSYDRFDFGISGRLQLTSEDLLPIDAIISAFDDEQ